MKIDKNIPIPESLNRVHGNGHWIRIFEKMNIGDSVLMDKEDAMKLYRSINGNRNYKKFKMVSRVAGDGKVRIWKTKR